MDSVHSEMEEINENNVFPLIPFDKRIIPNDLIRSSLFTVCNHNKKREYIKERQLYTFGNTKITYSGEELRQDDEDVWLHIIFLLSKSENDFIDFMPYSLIRHLQWPARTQYRDKLKDSINRMSATNITIYNKFFDAGLTLSLIRKFMWKGENDQKFKKWKVWLEPEIRTLFSGMPYSKIKWDQRRKLNPLAKWLHSYYSSHAEPYPVKVSTIHAACGSKTKAIKHFKSLLRKALCELVKIGFLSDYWIDAKNLVNVVRTKKKGGYTSLGLQYEHQ